MLFNSFNFCFLFLALYGIYRLIPCGGKKQFLLIASYLFYASFNPRFLALLFATTAVDFWIGRKIQEEQSRGENGKKFLYLCLLSNLSVLGFFKYAGFFLEAGESLFSLGPSHSLSFLSQLVLPLGLSFYTLHSISYVVDIYRKELVATKSFLDFSLYVAFFPQLISGPIQFGKQMLPQFENLKNPDSHRIKEGVWLFFWGLIQKTVVADNIAYEIVDPFLAKKDFSNGFSTFLILSAFSVQVFCDFDGYSNMARGLAKWFSIDLSVNFRLPRYAKSAKEIWQRFHITFYAWMRNYVFRSLAKERQSTVYTLSCVIVLFLISGLWHGARWTFVAWGLFEGLRYVVYAVATPFVERVFRSIPFSLNRSRTFVGILLIQLAHPIGSAFFRSSTLDSAFTLISSMLHLSSWSFVGGSFILFKYAIFTLPLFLLEYLEVKAGSVTKVLQMPLPWLFLSIFVLLGFLLIFGVSNAPRFLYFNF